ncbi:MAG: family 20 glycosylhydrolase [Armatimonadetes bacterium]|nr:family 20 glycosylhydrolase [Armatimonadota bacterium]
MPLRMWMLDLAREQAPTLDHLYHYAAFSLDAGYDTLGLYLEHRFAYAAAPWAQGNGCVTPGMVRRLQSEFPSLRIVPFINLLGHMEGFLNSEGGSTMRETPFRGMQACPSSPRAVEFCRRLLVETMDAFASDLVHIGGDETWELGACPVCSERSGGRSSIYGYHFGPLARAVVDAGKTPAVWGDMFLEHPDALQQLPSETVVFDWQYFGGLRDSAPRLMQHGHKIVGCPTLHVYDAAWMHVTESEANVREVSRDVAELGLEGVCLTTWESALFGAYDTVLPAVRGARAIMDDPSGAPGLLASYGAEEGWADLMSNGLAGFGGDFGFDGHRSRLKCRLLLYGNPFLAWKHHRAELTGAAGTKVLDLCAAALAETKDEGCRGVTVFVRTAVEFVQMAEIAYGHYAAGSPELAIKALSPARQAFDGLETVAKRTHERTGGSLADIERCRVAKEHVERVIRRISHYGRGELGYLPAFDVITHPRFVPHDQACWWGVNKWGDE